MAAAIVQYVFKPNPGSDMLALLEMIKEGAGIWRRHGAEVSLWGVQVGEIGNIAFTARFESTAKLGATLDALNNDPAMATWGDIDTAHTVTMPLRLRIGVMQ